MSFLNDPELFRELGPNEPWPPDTLPLTDPVTGKRYVPRDNARQNKVKVEAAKTNGGSSNPKPEPEPEPEPQPEPNGSDPNDPSSWIKPPPQPDLGIWYARDIDPTKIPPRRWLLGNSFCRKFLSSLIADGGVGKTALRIAQGLALAAGRSDITNEYVFGGPHRVLFVCFEDDADELNRRIAAAMLHHKVSADDLDDRLMLAVIKGKKLLQMARHGAIKPGELTAWLKRAIVTLKPDHVILDPFVKTHGLEENDNILMDQVCDTLATLAIEYNIGIDAPHHTRKGVHAAGNADEGRGASAVKDAARIVDTLTPMTAQEAEQLGISDRIHIRYDNGKYNLCPAGEARWFRFVGVAIGNTNVDPTYPKGDNVQTVEPWKPPAAFDGLPLAVIKDVFDKIRQGPQPDEFWARNRQAGEDWVGSILTAAGKSKNQAATVVETWIRNDVLKVDDYNSPKRKRASITRVQLNEGKALTILAGLQKTMQQANNP